MATATTSNRVDVHAVPGASGERLTRLRELSRHDPEAAQTETWAWFTEAGRRIQKDRAGATEELSRLFRSGTPSAGIDGRTEGMLVGFVFNPGLDRAIAGITTLWLPWAGKRFDAVTASGDNLMLRSARWPAKLLWPLYPMRPAPPRAAADRISGFDFETRVEPGALDPETDVLVIDYAPIATNPRVVIRSIRDELVEVVPGAHLGKMLWRHGEGPPARHTLLAYSP
ncbi:MAG: hypothetical protein M3O87_03695 [Candidatus Dormibacteraeota bacterium]|nr:hypothetical protein [Candidatus Dormibacteraeota bacterium]